jgi:predicted metalloprotease with PDZ domain
MLIFRDVNLQLSMLDRYNIFSIELTKKPGRGLGISIVGRKNEPGVYVSEIVKGGLAEQDGKLMQGDQILAVNTQDVTNSMQEDVATMLKTCTGKVTLKIGRWKLTETANRVHGSQPPSLSPRLARNENIPLNSGGPTPLNKEKNGENGIFAEEKKDVPPPAPSNWSTIMPPEVTIQDENQVIVHPDLSPVTEEPGSQHDLKSLTTDMEPPPTPTPMKEITLNPEWHEEGSEGVLISLKKIDGQQWGMGIGKRARGILITSLQPGSTAAEKLKVGDRIMAVNGEKIADQHSAVTLVKASGNNVIIQVARPTS